MAESAGRASEPPSTSFPSRFPELGRWAILQRGCVGALPKRSAAASHTLADRLDPSTVYDHRHRSDASCLNELDWYEDAVAGVRVLSLHCRSLLLRRWVHRLIVQHPTMNTLLYTMLVSRLNVGDQGLSTCRRRNSLVSRRECSKLIDAT